MSLNFNKMKERVAAQFDDIQLVSSQPYNVSKYTINTHYNLTL